MSFKSALIISGTVLVAALGVYWIAVPQEAAPEELYRQYMELSPFEQFEQREALLKKAAQSGYIPAMRQMAVHNFISKNELKADEYNYWIRKAADHGNAEAQYEAFMEGVSEVPSELISYLMQADRQSHAPASLELGRLYAGGDEEYGILRDEQKAIKLYQKAAAQNNPEALYLVYLMGQLDIPSKEEADRAPGAYSRYLQQAEQQKEFPILPPEIDISAPRAMASQRIREMLKTYLPQNEKVREWLEKNRK